MAGRRLPQRLVEWYRRRSPVTVWLDVLREAEVFEEWEEAALHLDNLLGLDVWRNNRASRVYDYRLINSRLAGIVGKAVDKGSFFTC